MDILKAALVLRVIKTDSEASRVIVDTLKAAMVLHVIQTASEAAHVIVDTLRQLWSCI